MARRAGMGPNDIGELDGGGGRGGGDDGDPDDWISKPFKFMKFESMFDDMLSEEAVQSIAHQTQRLKMKMAAYHLKNVYSKV